MMELGCFERCETNRYLKLEEKANSEIQMTKMVRPHWKNE